MSSHPFRRTLLALALALALPVAHAQSVGSAFTYQGELRASGTPANAAYDFQFRLYNSPGGTTQLGAQVTANAVTVNNGLFSVPLDFGPAQFAGDAQWLEISVRPAGSGTFETLSPRTAVTATPYALGAVAALANSVTTTSIVDGAIQFSDVNAAQFQARVTGTCTGSQGIQSIGANGTVVCGTFGGGGGTITGVTAGQGLTGGGTSGSVTLGIANGGVGAEQVNATQVQRRVSGACPSGQYVRVVNQDGTVVCGTDATGTPGWSLAGNAGTTPLADFLGTTDNQPFVIRTRNTQSLRIEPSAESVPLFGAITANIIAGSGANSVATGVRGATVSGGGVAPDNALVPTDPDFTFVSGNRITDHYGTVGGGVSNVAGDNDANATTSPFATVGGGYANTASGSHSTVAGGDRNTASAADATVAGGERNTASGERSAVVGGLGNSATGPWSMVGGGDQNCAGGSFSWAAGRFAKVRTGTFSGAAGLGCIAVPSSGDGDGDNGTFVWADSQDGAFQSTGPNQFLVRANGGMAINTNTPVAGSALTVNGSVSTTGAQNFGAQTRQMINLWGPTPTNSFYGIGVQAGTQYLRTDVGGSFAWFAGGVHNDAALNPGTGGARTMSLGPEGQLELVNSSTTVSPRVRLSFGATGVLANRFWDISASRNQINPGGPAIPAGSLIFADDVGIKAAFDINGLARNASGAWTSWSDERLKTDIRAIESPLETLLGMRGHWFEYRDPKAVMATPGPRLGLIAQEVRDVLPQWVSEGPDGMLSVTPTGFEALAIEALRELRDETTAIDALQANEIEALRAENAALREQTRSLLERMATLEARSGAVR